MDVTDIYDSLHKRSRYMNRTIGKYCMLADTRKILERFNPTEEGLEMIKNIWCNSDPSNYIFAHNFNFCQVHPRFPAMECIENRLATFITWPYASPSPKEIAKAGFFFVNFQDSVICYSCGLALWKWRENDDPWMEHLKSAMTCKHMEFHKGSTVMTTKIDYWLKDFPFFLDLLAQTETEWQKDNGRENSQKWLDITDQDNSLCLLCVEEERSMVFIPCGHIVACAKCALTVFVTYKCPFCNNKLSESYPVVKIFVP